MKNFIDKVKFDVNSVCDGHHKTTYRGIKAIRCPFDYLIYQMIVSEVKPDLIIEIGTNNGGGALYLSDLLSFNGNGIVHTIDIVDMAQDVPKSDPRIKFFTNGWQDYDIEQAKSFKNILIIEDSSHMYEDTLNVLKKFHSLVSIGSYFIVEDGIIDELGMKKEYNGGPLKAIKEFLNENNEFEIDRKWCDFFGVNATFNVNGYLKRIK